MLVTSTECTPSTGLSASTMREEAERRLKRCGKELHSSDFFDEMGRFRHSETMKGETGKTTGGGCKVTYLHFPHLAGFSGSYIDRISAHRSSFD